MSEVVVDYFEWDGMAGSNKCLTAVHPNAGGDSSGFAQVFTCGDNYEITKVRFYARRRGSPTMHVQARLYEITGTYGNNAVPTGTALAYSNLVDPMDWGEVDVWDWREWTFPSGQQYTMQKNHYYAIAIVVNDGSVIDSSNCVELRSEEPAGSHDGNSSHYHLGSWTPITPWDLGFYVYGELGNPSQMGGFFITD